MMTPWSWWCEVVTTGRGKLLNLFYLQGNLPGHPLLLACVMALGEKFWPNFVFGERSFWGRVGIQGCGFIPRPLSLRLRSRHNDHNAGVFFDDDAVVVVA